jgi:Ni,Fe-hydrogenase III large subunit
MRKEELSLATLANGRALSLAALPLMSAAELALALREGLGLGLRISAYFGVPGEEGGESRLFAILADDERNRLFVGRAQTEGGAFPSVAREFPQAQLFEREIAEQLGLVPEGHPWLKRVRFRRSWTGREVWGPGILPGVIPEILPGVCDFYQVEGEQVHQVAVGPVHAGVIEPGHFRFQCHGERVFHLEIALGYQHRGIEEAMIGGPAARSIHYAETAAGDSSIAHATSYCQALEALASGPGHGSPPRAQAIAAIALELERIANHVGDLGALAGDVGYLPSASFCGRLRGDFLNMSALICGSRFGRGLLRPGGLACDLDPGLAEELERRLKAAERDSSGAIDLMLENQSVLARLEDTGVVPRETAIELGLVGPAARASGLARDLRFDQSSGIYRLAQIPVSTAESGDALARAYVRRLEVQRSIAFVRELLGSLPAGPVRAEGSSGPLAPDSLVVAMNEAWRGEACHVAITDGEGRFARYKIVDPSFHNWPALAYAMRDEEISDFPICNKSFNLSYCGHDL